jgi:2-oxo-3-hexenedioate decarboxylase
MAIDQQTAEAVASRILAASNHTSSILPISDGLPGFDLADAYRVSAEIVRRRVARGERPVGWKIGFTNRVIWDEYGVHAPIWGPIYDTTAGPFGDPAELPLAGLMEPRLEPEIALRIARPPHSDMDERELFGCIDGIAHGFEIVQSVFPEWKFRAADTIAAFALHGRYRHGPILALDAADREAWLRMFCEFEIALFRDGVEMDRGKAENVLGSPLSALRHFVRGLAEWDVGWRVGPGDLVTTGTITRAFPIRAGERWSTQVHGLPLDGIALRFTP